MNISQLKLAAVLLTAILLPAFAGAQGHINSLGTAATPAFVNGYLGTVNAASKAGLRAAAKSALEGILIEHFGADGNEDMIATKVYEDKVGGLHVRFEQKLNGLPVAGAGMVLHAGADGSITAVNGDFVPGGDLPSHPSLGAVAAFNQADIDGTRIGKPELSYVLGSGGHGHLAWKASFEYVDAAGPQRDEVFVDTITGKVAARHPQIKYDRALDTQDCNQKTRRCRSVSVSPNTINTGDLAIDAAHNFAIATYDYYSNIHGRDSIDGAGMPLVSRVHYSRNYNNAFWDGTQMTYGDGDGVTFDPLSLDADVVAHELTHGVTERTSGLIYRNQSGALNEAWSDIFGAMVDRQAGGATGDDIWLIGEDIYTPGTSGDALRNMADPAEFGDFDYYPGRYTGTSDNGGVHWNSGIANLAFQLLVDGGTHPRGKTSVAVSSIGFDAAADIFYAANAFCLTPSSDFAAARDCTAYFAGELYTSQEESAVHAAWDAVGVPNDPPSMPAEPIELTEGVSLVGQEGDTDDIQQYFLSGVSPGETVTCSTSCNNGDADLYLRFGTEAEANPNSANNECGSYSSNSNESCTTGAAPSNETTLFAGVHAWGGPYSDLVINCSINSISEGNCAARGNSCTIGTDCCSGSCGGKPGTRTCR